MTDTMFEITIGREAIFKFTSKNWLKNQILKANTMLSVW